MGFIQYLACDGECGKEIKVHKLYGHIGPYMTPEGWRTKLNPRYGELTFGGSNPERYFYCPECWEKHKPEPAHIMSTDEFMEVLGKKKQEKIDKDNEKHGSEEHY